VRMDGFLLFCVGVSLVMGGVAHGIRVGGSCGVGASFQPGWLLMLLPSARFIPSVRVLFNPNPRMGHRVLSSACSYRRDYGCTCMSPAACARVFLPAGLLCPIPLPSNCVHAARHEG
jgi:hypothetical protein